MLKARLIPCLLLQGGVLVRSERFVEHQAIGYPLNEVQRFNEWTVDELIYLDISRDDTYEDAGRRDHKVQPLASPLEILEVIARGCHIPLTFGGRIRSIDDMDERFRRGADKVVVNTVAVHQPELVTEAAVRYGSQAVVVGIDARRSDDGGWQAWTEGGRVASGLDAVAWAIEAERLGAGEIFLNSIDRDGTGEGYDLDLVRQVCDAVAIPVIACGGVGRYEDFAPAVTAGASAVSAANIFHFKELSDRNAKRAMQRAGINVRLEPQLEL